MNVYNISVGSTLHICDDAGLDVIRPLAIKALKRGYEVKWFNGVSQWVSHEAVIDTSKNGSQIYTWSKDGEKVLHKTFLFTKLKDRIYSQEIGEVYRKD